jgi:hypothetical protein
MVYDSTVQNSYIIWSKSFMTTFSTSPDNMSGVSKSVSIVSLIFNDHRALRICRLLERILVYGVLDLELRQVGKIDVQRR